MSVTHNLCNLETLHISSMRSSMLIWSKLSGHTEVGEETMCAIHPP
jgi:hypothetical protein